ncbi:MAG: SDR family NAD(P)-dependent oxidoreductase [Alphaproteobacteria bacterium]
MRNSPSNDLVLVTGASSGIGFHLARLFAENGSDLILSASHRGRLGAAASAIRQQVPNARIDLVVADLARPEGARQLYEAAAAFMRPIHTLVSNAGVGIQGRFVSDTDLQAELAMIQLNAVAPVVLSKLAARDMTARGAGRILLTAAAAEPSPAAVYVATKAFLRRFAAALRDELAGSGVQVTTLLPAATDTDWFRRAGSHAAVGLLADPAEIARDAYSGMMAGMTEVAAPAGATDG